MKKLILTAIIIAAIWNLGTNFCKPPYPIPEFSDEMNQQICIEEGLY